MNVAELRVFLTVAKERSFSRAATKLYRTQPAVSQAVRRLEEDLGEPLFDRTNKKGTLTDAGRLVVTYGERIFQVVEETRAALRHLRQAANGRVLVGATESTFRWLLPSIVTFREADPEASVILRRFDATQIAAELSAGTLDFGLMEVRPTDETLLSVRLGSDQLVAVMRPCHRFARAKRLTADDVASETVLTLDDPSMVGEPRTRREPRAAATISLPSLDAITHAVEMGLGVGLMPRSAAAVKAGGGRLVAIPIAGLSRLQDIFLVHRSKEGLSEAGRRFLTVVLAGRGGRPRPSIE